TVRCSDCHSNATCDINLDRLECSCKDGFIGDGFSCSDIDECAYSWSHNCSLGVCVNTFGSYYCKCPIGYTNGPGNTCVDIDECSNPDINKCHPLATCTNYIGSYSCHCPPGVSGNGFICDIDHCSRHVCGIGMECIPTSSSYSCSDPCSNHTVLNEPWRSSFGVTSLDIKCDTDKFGWYRFIGNGGIRMPDSCVPENRCSTHAPMWLNGAHPLPADGIVNRTACAHWSGSCCHWSASIQVKYCPGGYHVYKFNRTPACSLAYCTDPSSLNDACTCTDTEECRFVDGSYGCYCKDGGDITALKDLTPSVTCGVQYMKTSFRKCQLKALEITVKDLILKDSSCFTIQDDNTTNTYSVVSTLKSGVCGMKLLTNKTHVTYVSSFSFLILNGIIIRDQLTTTSICFYPRDMRVSIDTALRPVVSTTNITTSGTGKFSARMAVFNDSTYYFPYEGSEVVLLTRTVLYVGILLDAPEPAQYAVVMTNCYATPSRSPDDVMKYYIIQNSCPNKQDGTINVIENGLSTTARFSLELFKFIGDRDLVYLHCQIYLCDIKTTVCTPSCSGSRSIRLGEDASMMSLGPFKR
ncbi:hypothetical protein GDO86_017420, partial [Hymenochirus boettgeri]